VRTVGPGHVSSSSHFRPRYAPVSLLFRCACRPRRCRKWITRPPFRQHLVHACSGCYRSTPDISREWCKSTTFFICGTADDQRAPTSRWRSRTTIQFRKLHIYIHEPDHNLCRSRYHLLRVSVPHRGSCVLTSDDRHVTLVDNPSLCLTSNVEDPEALIVPIQCDMNDDPFQQYQFWVRTLHQLCLIVFDISVD
jgi:hypothetical protein